MRMKEITAPIKEVLLYRNGARVVRVGKTELPKGEQVVKISGISQYAQADSFRVKGSGHASLRGLDTKRIQKAHEPEGDVGELVKNLKALEKKRDTLQDKALAQEARLGSLNSISSQFADEFGKWYSVNETEMKNYDVMDAKIVEMTKSAKKDLRKLNEELQEVNAEIAALQANIQKIRGTRTIETLYEAFVKLDVKQASAIEIELTYQMNGASWESTYDVDIGSGKTSMKRIAQVWNDTLEDWSDVALSISTASARRVEAVEPSPFYIDKYRPRTVATSSGFARKKAAKAQDIAYAVARDGDFDEGIDDLAEIGESYATPTETLGGTTVYEIPGRTTIDSGGEPQPITLTLEEFDSRRLHFWNAVDMAEVVAQDEITNGDAVLLPGNVKVYAAGDFIGETHIGLIAPREEFRLGTRSAYDLKAEKKLTLKDTEKAGLTRGKERREYAYTLEVTSFSKESIDIRMVDRIPYSSSEKIEVEVKQCIPQPKKTELGIMEWELAIPAGEKIEVTYQYTVEWEKGLHIRPPLP
jgi:uncharacterized protein (TIGR02231 family)